MDFEILHKGKSLILFEKWPKIRNHLMNALRRSRIACNENTPYITALSMEPPGTFTFHSNYFVTKVNTDKLLTNFFFD